MMEHPVDRDHPIVRHLWPLGPEGDPDMRVAAVVEAFMEDTGVEVSNPLSPDDRQRISNWLLQQEEEMPRDEHGRSAHLLRARPHFVKPLIHRDLATKLAWMQQQRCMTCVPVKVKPLWTSFAVHLLPFSAQSTPGTRLRRAKEAIRAHLAENDLCFEAWKSCGLCVNVVSVLPISEPVKDADNLVKGLLDAMQVAVYDNDRSIDHISSFRVRHEGAEGFYLVRITPVRDPAVDVFDLGLPPGWLGVPQIIP